MLFIGSRPVWAFPESVAVVLGPFLCSTWQQRGNASVARSAETR
jgi:hypothetical protein